MLAISQSRWRPAFIAGENSGSWVAEADAIEALLSSFDADLKTQVHLAMSGRIAGATLVAAPQQRNAGDEKKAIKEGRIPEEWRKNAPRRIAMFAET